MAFLRAIFVVLVGALAAAVVAWWPRAPGSNGPRDFVAFSTAVRGCPVIVPAAPSDAELRAAALLSATLARAAGRDTFPVVRESRVSAGGGIFVGETARGADSVVRTRSQPPFDDIFSARVADGTAMLRSARPGAIEITASWWLEKHLGAHWFMPGPLGGQVPRRDELKIAPGEERVQPAFLSRSLGVDSTWAAENKLEARLEHGHSYATIFKHADLLKHPELAPMRAGARFIPPKDGMQGWQPDLTSPAAVMHAVNYIDEAFAKEPGRESISLCQNDSVRYDDSPATLARVSPLRFFRLQPDYTPLVYRFTNEVADAVRVQHPDKWIGTYAYDWTEHAPDFRIAPNVVPFLTADRSQWFEPAFAAEDRATMKGWANAGPRIVGTYDYYEGAPYLVPRPTLYAVAAIPEIFSTGIRAFYGEGAPNWGLDGPKTWLAAQLLWNPQRRPAELLDVYYREFWQEAAEPMRAFYACAERAWLEQPHPGYWIKYYWDEDQVGLFRPALRAEMKNCLVTAAAAAKNEVVRARVGFVRDAFGVTDAFAKFCEERAALADAVASPATDETRLIRLTMDFARARGEFLLAYAELRRSQPLAIQTDQIEDYLRSDPIGAVQLRLTQSALGRRLLAAATFAPVESGGVELLNDPSWSGVTIGPIGGSTTFEWAGNLEFAHWRGYGDPFETRSVSWGTEGASGRALRFAGCKQETMSQIIGGVVPGRTYVGRVRLRAKVSPGNGTFLIVTFFDDKFAPFELGRTMRLPPGDFREWSELAVVAAAPPKARYVGIGLRVRNQVNDDFVEFASASLRIAPEKN